MYLYFQEDTMYFSGGHDVFLRYGVILSADILYRHPMTIQTSYDYTDIQ